MSDVSPSEEKIKNICIETKILERALLYQAQHAVASEERLNGFKKANDAVKLLRKNITDSEALHKEVLDEMERKDRESGAALGRKDEEMRRKDEEMRRKDEENQALRRKDRESQAALGRKDKEMKRKDNEMKRKDEEMERKDEELRIMREYLEGIKKERDAALKQRDALNKNLMAHIDRMGPLLRKGRNAD
ncbi:uncharacterized protein LOC144912600 isoform X1 [Branchiostoma floridae x Branchiostoma belcheri]